GVCQAGQQAPAEPWLIGPASLWCETPRRWYRDEEHDDGGRTQKRVRGNAPAPTTDIGDGTGDQPPTHAADGVAGDVHTRHPGEVPGVDLFGKVGDRDRRDTA